MANEYGEVIDLTVTGYSPLEAGLSVNSFSQGERSSTWSAVTRTVCPTLNGCWTEHSTKAKSALFLLLFGSTDPMLVMFTTVTSVNGLLAVAVAVETRCIDANFRLLVISWIA